MSPWRIPLAIGCLLALAATASAQRGSRGWRGPGPMQGLIWENDPEFAQDVFVFARVEWYSYDGRWRAGGWRNDYPDCDLNFSYRLQQMTSMKVDPRGVALELTHPDLSKYPFLYMSNINDLGLSSGEVVALRKYLLSGGFLMADDFWSATSWRHVYSQMKRVFPDREPVELTLDHPIFHIVYELDELPQVPSHDVWIRGDTFEYHHGDEEGDTAPHFQAWLDDDGHVMALLCHNNDIGDGWEREGENPEYFRIYSEKLSYPLGINIITYAMTH